MAKRKRKSPSRRTLLAQWSKDIRGRDNHTCIVCGAGKFIQAHHLLPKERYPEYQYVLDNGVSLCPTCHKFGKLSFHRNPIWSTLWLQANRPALYGVAVSRIADVSE